MCFLQCARKPNVIALKCYSFSIARHSYYNSIQSFNVISIYSNSEAFYSFQFAHNHALLNAKDCLSSTPNKPTFIGWMNLIRPCSHHKSKYCRQPSSTIDDAFIQCLIRNNLPPRNPPPFNRFARLYLFVYLPSSRGWICAELNSINKYTASLLFITLFNCHLSPPFTPETRED